MVIKSFSAALLERTVEFLQANKRDLRSEELATYHEDERVSPEYAATAITSSEAFRTENSLTTVSRSDFVSFLSPGNAASTFRKVVVQNGLEESEDEDLFSCQLAVCLAPGTISSFVSSQVAKGRSLALSEEMTATRTLLLGFEPNTTMHLRADPPLTIPEEDPVVRKKVSSAHQYVRDWLNIS
jgi:hypothetical protein